jgi:lysophospholipase L1-like esterase
MRYVRLKETRPNVDATHVPPPEYRVNCDDTLGEGPFEQRGTDDGFLMTGNYRPLATRNLVLLGGSFVESAYSHETDRFASIIERDLTVDWQVLNGGYSGTNTLHMLPVVSVKIPTVMTPGSKLVIFIGQSDTTAMNQDSVYWANPKSMAPVLPATLTQYSPWPAEEAVVRTIEALLSVADAYGFDYGVVASPYRDADFDTDPVLRRLYRNDRNYYERATKQREFIQASARSAALRRGRPFMNGQQSVEPTHFYDTMHLNKHGHAVFAAAFSDWLSSWIRR